jgi:hypothetical protein
MRHTLEQIGVSRPTFYRWSNKYLSGVAVPTALRAGVTARRRVRLVRRHRLPDRYAGPGILEWPFRMHHKGAGGANKKHNDRDQEWQIPIMRHIDDVASDQRRYNRGKS